MSDRFSDNSSSNTGSDRYGQGQGPTQGQAQTQCTRLPFSTPAPILPTDRTTRTSDLSVVPDPFRDSSDSSKPADPYLRRDPPSDPFNEQSCPSGTGWGQNYDQQGQQGQWRQGGQTGGDTTSSRGPLPRAEVYGDYGIPTGGYETQGNGGLGGKPTVPERTMGKLALFPVSSYCVVRQSVLHSGTAEEVVGKATGNTGMYDQGQDRKVCQLPSFNFACSHGHR